MKKKIIHARHQLPAVEDESYQIFGDLQFYPNGGKRLGPTFFAYRAPIHRHRFGANLVACQQIDQPNILDIETPFGPNLRFQYRPLYRTWYQLVDAEDPTLYLHQERYGTHIAVGLYYIRWATRWAFIKAIHFLITVLVIVVLLLIARLF